MIVPQYWSEAKIKKKVNGRQFTIMRFGWSDISEDEANRHAQQRVKEAEKILLEKGDVRRIDHRVSYNGAEGIPIREEVISRHGENVITRNSYGALCLNTPDVLFADIDLEDVTPSRLTRQVFLALTAFWVLMALLYGSWPALVVGVFLSYFLAGHLAKIVQQTLLNCQGGAEEAVLQNIDRLVQENPKVHLRIYRTPMGFRVLAMNTTFKPFEFQTIKLLNSLNSDPVYIQMCKNQNCFRARISPKPWRMGMSRLKSTAVWPIDNSRMAERHKWVTKYDNKARNYASCRFIKAVGSAKTVEKTEAIRAIHDEYCKVNNSDIELA